MISFKTFLLREGGNITVGKGDSAVSAEPFSSKNRGERRAHIEDALRQMHDEFHKEYKQHLFGKNASGISNGNTFAGSTKHLMNGNISDEEFRQHKPTVGDIDAQVSTGNKARLADFLTTGRKFGKYTVMGTKKHGNEISAVMKHANGEHHQFDFEGVDTDPKTHEPTKEEQFLHSADWNDTKSGIKGMHHKILLNAVGGLTHKFSITHGLRSRVDETMPGVKDPTEISRVLFGDDADHSKIHSFKGVSELIRDHVPEEHHEKILQKFKDSLAKQKGNHGPAIAHLEKTLGKKSSVSEEAEPIHHASVIPKMALSPISHDGHRQDLGETLRKLPGTKHVGISKKADAFSPDERKAIMDRQWGNVGHITHFVSGAGETIRRAYDSLPQGGRKVLHLLLGADRQDMAEGLKKSLEDGKIKEMEGHKFDEIHIHAPEDSDRSHGMSGTKMRQAAADGNEEEFHRHIGPMFTRKESNGIMRRVQDGIKSGKIKLKR